MMGKAVMTGKKTAKKEINSYGEQISLYDYQLKEVSVRLVLNESAGLYSATPISTPQDAVNVMGELLRGLDRETVCIVNMDNKLRAINYTVVSQGGISSSMVPVANCFKAALLSANAACVALLHNHPSGDATPSQEDFGFDDVGDYSFPYLSSWSSGRDMKELHASLSTIQQTSSQIISGIEKGMREQMLEQDVDRYEIYQIPIGSENRDKKFVSMDEVMKSAGEISRDDYALVYTSPLKDGDTLDSLYEKFNIDPPTDYAGHSMSVSDVVVLHQNHEDKAYYVDSMGFKEIPFEQGEPYVPGWDKGQQKSMQYMAGIASPGGSKAAVATDKGYFTIQQDGKDYDYTFYDKDFKEYHSGSLVDSGMSLTEAIKHVMWHSGETISNEAVVYGDIASKIDEKHKALESRSSETTASERIADQLPQQSRRESVLRSLRDKQQKVNAEFGFDRHGHKIDQKRSEQTL